MLRMTVSRLVSSTICELFTRLTRATVSNSFTTKFEAPSVKSVTDTVAPKSIPTVKFPASPEPSRLELLKVAADSFSVSDWAPTSLISKVPLVEPTGKEIGQVQNVGLASLAVDGELDRGGTGFQRLSKRHGIGATERDGLRHGRTWRGALIGQKQLLLASARHVNRQRTRGCDAADIDLAIAREDKIMCGHRIVRSMLWLLPDNATSNFSLCPELVAVTAVSPVMAVLEKIAASDCSPEAVLPSEAALSGQDVG